MTQHRRHLRNYLLDRPLQLRFAVIILLVAGGLTAGLGYFWYGEMRKASRIVEVKALATMSDSAVKEVEAEMASDDRMRLVILGGFGVLVALTLSGFSIMFTHRFAGPLFKISRHMVDISDNDLKKMWALRKGDQLQSFWETFEHMHTALRQRQLDDIKGLERLAAKLGDNDLARKDLDQLIAAKKCSLGSKDPDNA